MRSLPLCLALTAAILSSGCGGNKPEGLAPQDVSPPKEVTTVQKTASDANDKAPIDPLSDIAGSIGKGQPQESKAVTFEQAQKQVEETLKAHPNSYSLEMETSHFYMNAGHIAEAIPHLQRATKLTDRVFPWIALGDAGTIVGKFDLAKQAYAKAMEIDPGNSRVMRGIGQLYIAQQQFSKAESYFESCIQKYPQNTKLRVALGNLYIIENKAVKAIETLEPAVKAEPKYAEAHSLLGEAYARNLHIEAAIKEYEEVTKLDPNDAQAWGKIGLYNVNLTRYQQAREPLNKAIKLDPMEPHFYWALGDSWLLENPDDFHFDKAAQLYRQALNINPKNEKALYSFAMGLSRRGKPEYLQESTIYFERLLEINPNDMNACFKLAEAYRLLGKKDQAKKLQAKFLVLFEKGRQQNRDLYRRAAFKDTPDAYLRLGKKALDEQKYEIAIKYYESALQRDETLMDAKRGILEAQNRLGMLNKGQKP